MQFNKVIICLDGHSSKIGNPAKVVHNVASACRTLGLPFEFYKNPMKGWIRFRDELNQPDTLYILNDSAAFHLCEMPHVLISRSGPWLKSDPKPTTIGRLTQEMIGLNPIELIGIIARNKPMRQNHDLFAATTHFFTSEGRQKEVYNMARYGKASVSWEELIKKDIHTLFHFYESEGLPFVNQMLKDAIEIPTHPDDLIVITNRDICLAPEATGIIRAWMDSRNIDACFASRVDCIFNEPLSFSDLIQFEQYVGIDLFVLRPNAKCIPDLLETDLYFARIGWDSYWAHIIGNRLPYSICYHYPHPSDWHKPENIEQNRFNQKQIAKSRFPVPLEVNEYGAIYSQPI